MEQIKRFNSIHRIALFFVKNVVLFIRTSFLTLFSFFDLTLLIFVLKLFANIAIF